MTSNHYGSEWIHYGGYYTAWLHYAGTGEYTVLKECVLKIILEAEDGCAVFSTSEEVLFAPPNWFTA